MRQDSTAHSSSASSPAALSEAAVTSRLRASPALRVSSPSVCCRIMALYCGAIRSMASAHRSRRSGSSISWAFPSDGVASTWSSTASRARHSGLDRIRSVCAFRSPSSAGMIWSATSQRRVCTSSANVCRWSASRRPDGQARVSSASSWDTSSAACSSDTSGCAWEVRSPSSTWDSSWKAWIWSSMTDVYCSSASSAVMSRGLSIWSR